MRLNATAWTRRFAAVRSTLNGWAPWRVEPHPLGPRVYVLGQRVHEFALGFAVLALLATGLSLDLFHRLTTVAIVATLGTWLVAKDWRDIFPRWRNTQTHRRFGIHLPAHGRLRRGIDLPSVAALATLVVAAVNTASALTPNVAWRGHALLQTEPVAALPVFHAIAVPASIGLGLTAVYLRRRCRRALILAIVLLLLLGLADELKGLDFEEAALSAALAWALWYGRAAFDITHEKLSLRTAIVPLAVVATTIAVAATTAILLAGKADPSVGVIVDQAAAFLSWRPGPLPTDDPVVAYVVRLLVVCSLAMAATVAFRPRRPRTSSGQTERRQACDLVRAHGRDTLAAFKLRGDLDYLFEPEGRAFVGYRIENGSLLIAGDPVGTDSAIPAVITTARAFARNHGLRVGAVGASSSMLSHWRDAGFRAAYIGDEAIVDTSTFTLEGRAIRKVRQSVNRLEALGFTASLDVVSELDASTLDELDAVSKRWRTGQLQRGFAMSVTALSDGPPTDAVVLIARDGDGTPRGWIHFLPSYGRSAMSLALMRRDPNTPNGLMEFLIARSIEHMRERGILELSLNFAAFSRPLRNPSSALDRVSRVVLRVASRWFQIESLYRFNAKFLPRWEPRYVVYARSTALPALGLAILKTEGQLPRCFATRLRARRTDLPRVRTNRQG